MSSVSDSSSQSFLGPDYPYYKQIKNPTQLGMNDKGSNIGTNFTGLMDYVQLLVSGTSKASKTGKPLGNRFFLQTLGKCTAKDTGNVVPRFLYFDNIPQGRIPILSDALGTNMTSFRGLIPGVISGLNNFNPSAVTSALTAGVSPQCQNVTLQVVDENNQASQQTHYVATVDLENLDPCSFPGKVNLVTKKKCNEGFEQQNSNSSDNFQFSDLMKSTNIFVSVAILFLLFFFMYLSFTTILYDIKTGLEILDQLQKRKKKKN